MLSRTSWVLSSVIGILLAILFLLWVGVIDGLSYADYAMKSIYEVRERIIEQSVEKYAVRPQANIPYWKIHRLTIHWPHGSEYINEKESFTLTGSVANATSIRIRNSCSDEVTTLQKFKEGDTEWRYNISIALGNLCSLTEYSINSYGHVGQGLASTGITIRSAKGVDTIALEVLTNEFARLRTGKVQTSVQSDPALNKTPPTTVDMKEYCRANFGTGTTATPFFFGPAVELGDGLWARVRDGEPGDEKNVVISPFTGVAYVDKRPTLVFYHKPRQVLVPYPSIPTINGWGTCMQTDVMRSVVLNEIPFHISYVRPDRIFVDGGTGFETYPVSYIFDGKEWKLLSTFLTEKIPAIAQKGTTGPLMMTVNADYFSIKETGYCCDTVERMIPTEEQEFIFSTDTLKLVDVISRPKDPRTR